EGESAQTLGRLGPGDAAVGAPPEDGRQVCQDAVVGEELVGQEGEGIHGPGAPRVDLDLLHEAPRGRVARAARQDRAPGQAAGGAALDAAAAGEEGPPIHARQELDVAVDVAEGPGAAAVDAEDDVGAAGDADQPVRVAGVDVEVAQPGLAAVDEDRQPAPGAA